MLRHQPSRTISAIFCTLTLAVSATPGAAQQRTQPPRDTRAGSAAVPVGTASVAGTVLVAGSGLPARKARVNLSGTEIRGGRSTTVDEQGRFSFTSLPAGRYSLSASKPGHVSVTYGQRQPGRPGTPIELSDGQKFDARLQLPRGGVITGTVLDELGEPSPGTQIRVMRYVMQAGARTLQSSNSASTDDRGMYRVYGLQPGEYVVCATPRNVMAQEDRLRVELNAMRQATAAVAARDPSQAAQLAERVSQIQAQLGEQADEPVSGYAPVCYPGTTVAASASPVAVGVSEERAGIDFPLQLVSMARVEGVVLNPTGAPLQNIQVTLASASGVPGLGSNSTRADSEGRFRISNVAPGQYKVIARATVNQRAQTSAQVPGTAPAAAQARAALLAAGAQAARVWAAADLSIDGRNVSNVTLTLQQGITVSGQLAFEGTTQVPPDLTRARVSLSPVGANTAFLGIATGAAGRVDSSGRFTIANVMPGRYRLSGSAGVSGWTTESAVMSGQDTADFPIEIKGDQNISGATLTFTDKQSELSGSVVDGRGQPATDYTVIIFPSDQRYWSATRRIQTARPATSGQFAFRSLPPGDYRIATVIDPEPGAWSDPAFLQQLDGASIRVTIAPGEKKVQNLRVSGS